LSSDESGGEPADVTESANLPLGELSPAERTAALKRAVHDLTREARAQLRRKGQFEAVIVRGRPVNHRLHLIVLIVLVGLVALAFGRTTNPWYVTAAVVAAVGYAIFFAFIALTGGEQIEVLSVDERGRISSRKSGRDPGLRGDRLRVVIPLVLIVASGWIVLGLGRDIAVPPKPNCPGVLDTDACWTIPINAFGGDDAAASTGPSAVTPIPGRLPSPSPSLGPVPATSVKGSFTVGQVRLLERIVRVLQLVFFSGVLLGSVWFLRRMLTGRQVLIISPVGYRKGQD
jgi:hypothetical protein